MSYLKIWLHGLALGGFLSTVGYMFYLDAAPIPLQLAYVIISIMMLSGLILFSKTQTTPCLPAWGLGGVICSLGYFVLYVYAFIYKELIGLGRELEWMALTAAVLTGLLLVFDKRWSLSVVLEALKTLTFRSYLLQGFTITAVSAALKMALRFVPIDNHIVEFLLRSVNVFWVVWLHLCLPVLVGSLVLLYVAKHILNAGLGAK